MGTSSIFNGRSDKNPLLPDDYEEELTNMGSPVEVVSWQTVKSDMSKFVRSGGNYGSMRHVAQQYIRATGGTSKMMSQSHSGIRTGSNIGNFLANIRTNGIAKTFQSLGIALTGKSAKEIFSRLVDVLSPKSNTKEDIAAKEAAQAALSKLYDYVEKNNLDISCMEKMPPVLMNEALCEYTGAYIWTLMMKDIGSRIEKYLDDSQRAYDTECGFKAMIMGIVKVEFAKHGDIVNKDVSSAMHRLYEKCLKVMEGIT